MRRVVLVFPSASGLFKKLLFWIPPKVNSSVSFRDKIHSCQVIGFCGHLEYQTIGFPPPSAETTPTFTEESFFS